MRGSGTITTFYRLLICGKNIYDVFFLLELVTIGWHK